MKVLIISPCGYPIPAVKGGAVLTLIMKPDNSKKKATMLNLRLW